MKLKSLPEDFEVEELSDFPLERGQFAVYLLTKRSLGTPEAITAISERWNIPRRVIGYGGLKDKHAVTRQIVFFMMNVMGNGYLLCARLHGDISNNTYFYANNKDRFLKNQKISTFFINLCSNLL